TILQGDWSSDVCSSDLCTMSFALGRTTIPYERQTAASRRRVPVSQRQSLPIRHLRATLRTLAGVSPAGSTLTTSTVGRACFGSRSEERRVGRGCRERRV